MRKERIIYIISFIRKQNHKNVKSTKTYRIKQTERINLKEILNRLKYGNENYETDWVRARGPSITNVRLG